MEQVKATVISEKWANETLSDIESAFLHKEIMRKAMELKKDMENALFPKFSKLKGRKLEPKYKDPVSGKTWAGRGRLPKWVVGDKEQYRIK